MAFKLHAAKQLLIFVITTLLAFCLYHLGVENHWWVGPQSCISELPTLENITTEAVVKGSKSYCDRANWLVFGVSSTLWSFLISAFLFWFTTLAYALDYYIRKCEDD